MKEDELDGDDSLSLKDLQRESLVGGGLFEGCKALLVVRIAKKIAEKHKSQDEMLSEVQNAISTDQPFHNLLRVEYVVLLSCMTGAGNPLPLVQYWT